MMNNYREVDLSTENSLRLLQFYGFLVNTSEKHSNFYLIRIRIKNKIDNALNIAELNESDNSLKLFISNHCEGTDFDEDKIPFEQFVNLYD